MLPSFNFLITSDTKHIFLLFYYSIENLEIIILKTLKYRQQGICLLLYGTTKHSTIISVIAEKYKY